jgi:hypothetical protein
MGQKTAYNKRFGGSRGDKNISSSSPYYQLLLRAGRSIFSFSFLSSTPVILFGFGCRLTFSKCPPDRQAVPLAVMHTQIPTSDETFNR